MNVGCDSPKRDWAPKSPRSATGPVRVAPVRVNVRFVSEALSAGICVRDESERLSLRKSPVPDEGSTGLTDWAGPLVAFWSGASDTS